MHLFRSLTRILIRFLFSIYIPFADLYTSSSFSLALYSLPLIEFSFTMSYF